ncbi:hypothetical protein GCM10009654_08700 [Streptomyces hebeiensis]|uniref:Uncharacterized protein n=1 Tax=Streptomyces hebeiensis TaxID=229486 RepID=A0ABP4F6T4_9ACTN
MLDIPREALLVTFILSYAFFSLIYIMLTVTWGQRAVLLWILIPLGGGIGIGLGKGESIDLLLFSFSGAFFMLPLLLLLPRGKRKELNRREAAGEKVDWKEGEPPTWAVWTFTCAICLWAVVSFIVTGG